MLETSSDYGGIRRHNYHRAILAAADHESSDMEGDHDDQAEEGL